MFLDPFWPLFLAGASEIATGMQLLLLGICVVTDFTRQ